MDKVGSVKRSQGMGWTVGVWAGLPLAANYGGSVVDLFIYFFVFLTKALAMQCGQALKSLGSSGWPQTCRDLKCQPPECWDYRVHHHGQLVGFYVYQKHSFKDPFSIPVGWNKMYLQDTLRHLPPRKTCTEVSAFIANASSLWRLM